MNVIDLCGDQFPNRRLDLRFRLRHPRAIDKRRPRRVTVAEVVQCGR